MKSPLKPDWSDYALIILTCLLVLAFFELWKKPVEDWLKDVTRPERSAPEPRPDPEPLRDWLDRRNETAPTNAVSGPAAQSPGSPNTPPAPEKSQ